MAIRYTPEYNKRIRQVVKNYNLRLSKARQIDKVKKADLPDRASVKILKTSFTRRQDLERELRTLEKFSRQNVKQQVGRVTNYDREVIKKNRQATIKYFENTVRSIRKKDIKYYPGEQARVKTIEQNLDILRKGVSRATESEIETMKAYVDKYRKSFQRQASGYRGFMSEIEQIIDTLNIGASEDEKISDAEKDAFFKKFSVLTPEELYELYESSDLIDRVYRLADSPKYTGGELKIYASDDYARTLIKALMDEADLLISEVKSNS